MEEGRGRERWVLEYSYTYSSTGTYVHVYRAGYVSLCCCFVKSRCDVLPHIMLFCRYVKPKPTTVTHTWIAINAQNTCCRNMDITSTGVPKKTVLVAVALGFRTTQQVSQLPNGTRTTITPNNSDIQTDRQTFVSPRHTYHMVQTYFVGRGGVPLFLVGSHPSGESSCMQHCRPTAAQCCLSVASVLARQRASGGRHRGRLGLHS